jgi:hypothetical protein
MLAATPVLAAVLAYRAAVRLTGRSGPSVVAASTYALSGIVLWSYSEGRVGGLVALAALPVLVERFEIAFGGDPPADGRWRFVAGLGVTLAVGVAFEPGILLGVIVMVAVQLAMGRGRRQGLELAGLSMVAAAILLFPFVPTLVAAGGRALGAGLFTRDVSNLATLTLGGGPGTWFAAASLPLAGVLAFGLVGSGYRDRAVRAMLVALVGLALAGASGMGYLPESIANAPVYLSLVAATAAFLVAYGLSSVLTGLGREAFGLRQVTTAVLTAVLGAGLSLQAVASMIGGWAVGGPAEVPAAWAIVRGPRSEDFRVLWVGGDRGTEFPYPGGQPDGVIDAGEGSLRFAVTGPEGASVLDIGRPLVGPARDRLESALREILSGATAHGGALLAPFGVRFVVAADGDLPPVSAIRFDAQVDLDLVPASGLVIYRNPAALPPASVVAANEDDRRLALSGDPADTIRLRTDRPVALARAPGGWKGTAHTPGLAVLSTEFDPAWVLVGSTDPPARAFGWATAFDVPAGAVRARHGAQLPHTIEATLLACLWLAALWITRRPVAR